MENKIVKEIKLSDVKKLPDGTKVWVECVGEN